MGRALRLKCWALVSSQLAGVSMEARRGQCKATEAASMAMSAGRREDLHCVLSVVSTFTVSVGNAVSVSVRHSSHDDTAIDDDV